MASSATSISAVPTNIWWLMARHRLNGNQDIPTTLQPQGRFLRNLHSNRPFPYCQNASPPHRMFPTDNGQTLAEPTRTDIEKELVGLFYHGDKTGLINIITIVLTDIYKIHHPLRNALAIGIHNRLLWIYLQAYDFFLRNATMSLFLYTSLPAVPPLPPSSFP